MSSAITRTLEDFAKLEARLRGAQSGDFESCLKVAVGAAISASIYAESLSATEKLAEFSAELVREIHGSIVSALQAVLHATPMAQHPDVFDAIRETVEEYGALVRAQQREKPSRAWN